MSRDLNLSKAFDSNIFVISPKLSELSTLWIAQYDWIAYLSISEKPINS